MDKEWKDMSESERKVILNAQHVWLENLKVGDTVCDCRYRHLKIVELFEERYPPRWFRRITAWIPGIEFYGWIQDLYMRFFNGYLWDKSLILEDGAHCSAINCCSPVDHDYVHDVYDNPPYQIDDVAMQQLMDRMSGKDTND